MNDIDRFFPVAVHAELVRKVIEADATRDAALFASLFTAERAFASTSMRAAASPTSAAVARR
jgi:hypothetical protein